MHPFLHSLLPLPIKCLAGTAYDGAPLKTQIWSHKSFDYNNKRLENLPKVIDPVRILAKIGTNLLYAA
jgi:hypothetical protein